MPQHVEYEIRDFVAHLRLNRPPVNALNSELIAELHELAGRVNRDAEAGTVRVAILSARGKHFCAGADLKERRGVPEDQVEAMVNRTRAMTTALAQISVPFIAAIHGTAVGGGMEVALAADIRVLADSAKMGLRETALAIIPGAGGTQRLPRLIGESAAVYWITSARVFSAAECEKYGVANFVVPETELMTKAESIAAEIAANGPLAVRAAKEAIVRGRDASSEDGLKIEQECYRKIIPTHDRVEALQAFQEKRPPQFRGE